ncbi:fructose-1%2C6-bisphosphatase [Neisseria gonorrhoeae]|nr:fructose-1,6-bisphosphatase class 1 [Neisseria gonorrhoeae MS11]KLS52409.1 fructose-1,6-bisphosphatase [Neisseria gonorrhoeae MIA_2011_02_02]KLS60532.1 fructose-1,6-bisphosphatase [Neisseria gonorrhoeae NYC_2011_05_13]KLS82569.1 fructose-1,6-bisphosphatase [Neisseria gonorrhoeae MU_NG21]QBK51767.1 fructose-1,6-bisphosphatase [Neisseria gonorrhoeae]
MSIFFKNKFGILYFSIRLPRSDLPRAVFFHYNPTRYPAERTKGTPRSNLPPFRRHKPFRNEQTMDTLTRFLPEHLQQNQLPEALGGVLLSVVSACTEINAKVRLGALAGVLGMAGTGNIQGEDQKKLDVIANNIMIDTLKANPAVAGLASEEEDTFVSAGENGRYLVLFDPLDGSSNIDVNISVGTIFSILAKPEGALATESFLQTGRQQLAAGYVLYGPQTQLAFTFGHGVYVFTLNAENEFVLTKENPKVPESTKEFAINMSNRRHWLPPVQQYVDELLAGETGTRGKNYNMRWVASMVAEIHRILMRGGVFMYLQDKRDPSKPGKLRLMYEANPMALILEQAGASASNAYQAMLDIQPESLHQRVAVIMGSSEEVDYLNRLHSK